MLSHAAAPLPITYCTAFAPRRRRLHFSAIAICMFADFFKARRSAPKLRTDGCASPSLASAARSVVQRKLHATGCWSGLFDRCCSAICCCPVPRRLVRLDIRHADDRIENTYLIPNYPLLGFAAATGCRDWFENSPAAQTLLLTALALGFGRLVLATGAPEQTAFRVFEKGKLDNSYKDGTSIDRIPQFGDLERLVRPESITRQYHVIAGELGTGKSTLIRQLVQRLSSWSTANGVVYIEVSDFALDFTTALVSLFEMDLMPISKALKGLLGVGSEQQDDARKNWSVVRVAIVRAAEKFFAAHGRPAVLVIDSCEHLAAKCPDFLTTLRWFAKDMCEAGTLVLVFVFSDGKALQHMEKDSTWSRARQPYEIGDISDVQAVQYLQRNSVAPAKALQLVQEISGRAVETVAIVSAGVERQECGGGAAGEARRARRQFGHAWRVGSAPAIQGTAEGESSPARGAQAVQGQRVARQHH